MPGTPARFWVARRARAFSCISGHFLLVLKLVASGTARQVDLRPAGGKSTVKNCSKNRKQENCKPRDAKLFPQAQKAAGKTICEWRRKEREMVELPLELVYFFVGVLGIVIGIILDEISHFFNR